VTFSQLSDDRFQLIDAAHAVTLDVSRLRRQNHNLLGELAVSCGILSTRGDGGIISVANFNLSDARARADRARILATHARTQRIDWISLLETLCQRVLAAEREGRPAVVLSTIDRPQPDAELEVEGLRVPKGHASILFGDGGTLKSFTCLLVAGCLVQTGLRVGLFDWELDAFTHRLRLERLFGADMPPVRYVRCDRPLVHEVDRLARIVEREQLDYAIFDSCGFACDGPPEAAESALNYFRAVRQLRIGSLHIAHTTKTGEAAEQRPFGSTFWHNSARSTWFAKQASVSPDGRLLTIGLFNRKQNLGALRPAVGFEIAFDDERTSFQRVNVASIDELAASVPLWQRIKAELQSGAPKTIAALAERLAVKTDSVEKSLKRRTDLFTRVPGGDGVHRFALVERRSA